jgi:hypothetical protein
MVKTKTKTKTETQIDSSYNNRSLDKYEMMIDADYIRPAKKFRVNMNVVNVSNGMNTTEFWVSREDLKAFAYKIEKILNYSKLVF